MEAFDHSDNPYLQGPYAPVFEELGGTCEVIEGEVPRDLSGTYLRNGPNPRFTPIGRHHWFDGDGMIHAVTAEEGVLSYRNRWLGTEGLRLELDAGRPLWRGIMESARENPRQSPYKDTANTDVVAFRGEALALWYLSGSPIRIDPRTLESRRLEGFDADKPLRMSAHAKVDPSTGGLCFFDFGMRAPFMRYGCLSADGSLSHLGPIEVPGPRLPHDMAITSRHAVLMDLPIHFDEEALRRGRWRSLFRDDLPARFCVIPKGGGEGRWFEAEPCYIYHTVNAWEEGDEVVLLACRVADPLPEANPEDGPYAQMLANLRVVAHLHRWRFNLRTGAVTEEQLDDANTDFPAIDQRFLGAKTRFSYNVRIAPGRALSFDGLVRYDLESGDRMVLPFGPGRMGNEVAFAPREGGTAEGDGYLVTFVHDQREGRSEVVLYDAGDLEAGPVVRAATPQRVPLGFHACWVEGGSGS